MVASFLTPNMCQMTMMFLQRPYRITDLPVSSLFLPPPSANTTFTVGDNQQENEQAPAVANPLAHISNMLGLLNFDEDGGGNGEEEDQAAFLEAANQAIAEMTVMTASATSSSSADPVAWNTTAATAAVTVDNVTTSSTDAVTVVGLTELESVPTHVDISTAPASTTIIPLTARSPLPRNPDAFSVFTLQKPTPRFSLSMLESDTFCSRYAMTAQVS